LRTAVNKLLLDFRDTEQVEFSGKIKNLHELLNKDHEETRKRKEAPKTSLLGSGSRSLEEIESNIDSMLAKDFHLGKIFKDLNSSNPKIKSLADELKQELLKMTQIILLDKHRDFSQYSAKDRKNFEKILGQMSDPQQHHAGQLNLIDQFLRQTNGDSLLSDIFQMASPYLLQSFGAKLQEECKDVLKEIDYKNKQYDYLLYYFMQKDFPMFQTNKALQRLYEYSE
jgi:hypothetical protein